MSKHELTIREKRDLFVVKANDIIQEARYNLSITELKIMAYLISQVRRDDKKGAWYTFSTKTFCQICGIDYDNGGNYKKIKQALQGLRDKSFWMPKKDGSESTVGWLDKANVHRRQGDIKVRFDTDLHDYLRELYGNYTQYELFYTLPMQSKYSFRVYELVKSYHYYNERHFTHIFDVEDLKRQLMAPYKNFKDFRIKVLEVAESEINAYTDFHIRWEPIKEGRKVVQVQLHATLKDAPTRIETMEHVENLLDGIDNTTPIKDLLSYVEANDDEM